jgi:hypothetical protein
MYMDTYAFGSQLTRGLEALAVCDQGYSEWLAI